MRSLSAPFILRPVATTLLSIALFIMGCLGYAFLPVANLPNVEFPVIRAIAMGEGELHRTANDFGQDGGFLHIGPGNPQRGAGQHHGCEIGFEHQGFAELFHHQHDVHSPAAEAAIGFVERQAKQAHFSELAPHIGAPASILLLETFARFECVAIAK